MTEPETRPRNEPQRIPAPKSRRPLSRTAIFWITGGSAPIVLIWYADHPLLRPVILLAVAAVIVRSYLSRRAWKQYWAAIRAARSMEIGRYHQMGPKEFEEAIAYLCTRDGCTQVRVVGGAGDLGADVIAITPDGRKLVIQCKRYTIGRQVSGPDLQKFGGTCYAVHQAGVATVVTTSGFTKQARQYGAHMRIGLWDNDALAGWASRTGPAPWM